MRSTQDKGKLFDILPPPLEKITRGHEKPSLPITETKEDTKEVNNERVSNNVEFMQMKRAETISNCLMKQDSIAKNTIDEMDSVENIKDEFMTYEDNSIFSFPTNNYIRHSQDTQINEPPTRNKTVDRRTKKNDGFDISSVYKYLILTKEEINEVVESNDEFRNLLESETITQFMDDCLKDPIRTFENYKSDKDVLKFIQLLLNYMCAKYSHHHTTNLHEHFTFKKRN